MAGEREQRFAHLLQPIRELASNWSIDIATSLEDYLEELEHITITLEGGESNLNFAEAALLIQGSTCIYSRKVEHLYALVLQTIDHLTNQHRARAGGAAKDGGEGDEEGDGAKQGGEAGGFLLLDDLIEEGADIDLPPVEARRGGAEITRPAMFLLEQDHGSTFRMSTCQVDASGALMIDGSQCSASGFSGSGGAAAATSSQLDESWAGFGQGLSGGFENSYGNGDASDGDDDDDNHGGYDHDGGGGGGDGFEYDGGGAADGEGGGVEAAEGGAATEAAPGEGEGVEAQQLQLQQQQRDGDQAVAAAAAAAATAAIVAAAAAAAAAPLPAAHARAAPPPLPQPVENDPWAMLDPHDPGTRPPKPWRKGRTFRVPASLKAKKGGKGGAKKREQEAGAAEEAGGDGRVPLTGLAYPDYILKRERRRKAAALRAAQAALAAELRGGGACADDDDADVNAQDGAAADEDYGDGGGGAGAGLEAEEAAWGDGGDGFDHDGGGGGGDDDDSDGDPAWPAATPRGGFVATGVAHLPTPPASAAPAPGPAPFAVACCCRMGVRKYSRARDGGGMWGDGGGGADWDGGEGEGGGPLSLADAFRDAPQTYEDLCRSHIQAFMRGAEQAPVPAEAEHDAAMRRSTVLTRRKALSRLLAPQNGHAYAQETGLSRRVGAWQDRLEPLLREQSARAAFDMRACGDAVLASAVAVLPRAARERLAAAADADAPPPTKDKAAAVDVVAFGRVVAGRERFDVCRMFLASLQLANSGCVALRHAATAREQGRVPFELQVLRAAAPQEVAGFFAPSVAETRQQQQQQQHMEVAPLPVAPLPVAAA
ncbi:hypothetical protein JKP88DRAFT_312427 [Tribonema minus]|uniref:Condensin-2 complex subunit H2 n=1 Tax=Tribonema minus TaxID=303371 RepID=A0A836CG43_9STRA|nr:hypothetical protein JKP88DRAFT_312427 [Tribonema minus]